MTAGLNFEGSALCVSQASYQGYCTLLHEEISLPVVAVAAAAVVVAAAFGITVTDAEGDQSVGSGEGQNVGDWYSGTCWVGRDSLGTEMEFDMP